ncbi:MAG: methylmalonyl-CoA epimerase [Candidatus Eisenbacteria bacterium]|nr:methylmalonyl-CoA epimerase [Candidatus Eisenbacteria bacterium]
MSGHGIPRSPEGAAAGGATGPDRAAVQALSHIAIATADAEALASTLVAALGGTRGAEEVLDGGTLRVLFVHLGPVTFELLQPLDDSHTVARFLRERGPGLHHVSLEVADLAARLAAAKASGARLVDEAPRPGAHGSSVAFLHPKSFGGVLIELCGAKRQT